MSPIFAHVCEIAGLTYYCLCDIRCVFGAELINLIAPVT